MTIGIDGSRAFEKNRTGTENYSFQILRQLAEIDKENHYLVYLRPGAAIKVEEWPDNFRFIDLNYPRFWTQIGLALRTFQDHLDVLWVPAHTLPLIRRPHLKTVMTVHDLGAEYLPAMHQLKQRLYLGFITRWQLKTATKLIAVSKATKEDLIKRVGVDSKKVAVVYEAVDPLFFKPVKNDALSYGMKKYDLSKKNYFLFIGTIQPRKNLARLIEAFSKYRGPVHKLALAGGKGWLSDPVYLLPKQLGVEDRVVFLGRVPDQDLPALYSGAAAFVFPSLFEGFGLPILEAFGCDCPVLTSSVSSMPEVGGEAVVYVDPTSIKSIVTGLEEVVKGSRERIKMGKKQLEKFSWRKAATETLTILKGA